MQNAELGSQGSKQEINKCLLDMISGLLDNRIPVYHDLDQWVEKYFSGKTDITDILSSLSRCHEQERHCGEVFTSIAERSPTALVLTLKLLRWNEGRSLETVFDNELKASRFITRHPDYIEGVRARLVDRDNQPKWNPDDIRQVDLSGFTL